jgi:hypothetical protein
MMWFFDRAFTPRRAPTDRRGELEQRIKQLQMMKWSSPEDRRELEGMIEEAERALRELVGGGSR